MKVDLKVVLLGAENIGKTCLVHRISKGTYRGEYENTIGAAFCAKRINVDSKAITIGIWDTAGAEKFESISEQYTRNSNTAIICYDVSDRLSFEKAKQWIVRMKREEPECKIFLTGTKCDLPNPVVTDQAAAEYAYIESCSHIRTSSKENLRVTELFYKIAKDHVTSLKEAEQPRRNIRLNSQTVHCSSRSSNCGKC